MPISSSSIFHFTKTKTALKGILKDEFKVKYCLETVKARENEITYACPMVSFCDIPLSQVKDHIGKYGAYGIGLTKQWAQKQKLSPVQYITAGSLYAESLAGLVNSATPDAGTAWKDITAEERAGLDVMRYIKNYEGDLKRKGKTVPSYRFYDEREWRYVPKFSDNFPMVTFEEEISTKSKKERMNRKLSKLRLKFKPADIKYIIVKSDAEISEFVELIRKSKGKHYSLRETERLTTRILTKEQIETDF